jgi:hypothetical protein
VISHTSTLLTTTNLHLHAWSCWTAYTLRVGTVLLLMVQELHLGFEDCGNFHETILLGQ